MWLSAAALKLSEMLASFAVGCWQRCRAEIMAFGAVVDGDIIAIV